MNIYQSRILDEITRRFDRDYFCDMVDKLDKLEEQMKAVYVKRFIEDYTKATQDEITYGERTLLNEFANYIKNGGKL